jgi:tetratricopeptide (TPR) repeat protein
MKKILLFVLLYTISTPLAFSQNNQLAEAQKLTRQAYALYQQGKFDEAIALAEKVVNVEKNSSNKNLQNLAVAVLNLALLQKEYYWILKKDLSRKDISKEQSDKSRDKRVAYSQNIEESLYEVIKIYKDKLKSESPQLASAQIELAKFLDRFNEEGVDPLYKSEIVSLYSEGLGLREKLLGTGDDLTIATILDAANFYQKIGEFEKSLPLYEKYIQSVEAKYTNKSELLLPALRASAALLAAIENENEANEIVKRISLITGKTEKLPEASLNLTIRNKANKSLELIEDSNTMRSYLKKQKWLLVNVVIDENGRIIEAKAGNVQEKDIFGKNIPEKAEKDVFDWKFKPFVYKGMSRKIKGIIWYPYFVKA